MPRLSWSTLGKHYYETGVDRGVLYVDTNNGVAWNGLVSVTESPSGGDAKPFYQDGFKYLNLSAVEEFEATIEAYSSPREFDECDGISSLYPGLLVTNQRRKPFGFCYRTRVGNDIEGVDHAYKIKLIYNALASPTDSGYHTISDATDPMTLSWAITTSPPFINDYRPTSQIVIDSRTADSSLLTNLEDILYGSDTTSPRLPDLTELTDLFGGYDAFRVTLNGDGSYTAEGIPVTLISADEFTLNHERVVDNGDGSFTIL